MKKLAQNVFDFIDLCASVIYYLIVTGTKVKDMTWTKNNVKT